jgi:hypothetical protein
MRNGDYTPTRLESQQDAVNVLISAKLGSNPENSVGLLTFGKRCVCVCRGGKPSFCSPTSCAACVSRRRARSRTPGQRTCAGRVCAPTRRRGGRCCDGGRGCALARVPPSPRTRPLPPPPSPLVRARPPIPPQHPPPELPVRGRGQAPREHHGPEGGGVRRRVRRRPGRWLPGRPQDVHARAQAPQEQGRRAEGHRLRREPGRHGRAGPQEARGAAAQVERACSRWMWGQSPTPRPPFRLTPLLLRPPLLPAPTRRSASTSSSWARTT